MGLDLDRVAEVVRVPSLCSESVLDVQPARRLEDAAAAAGRNPSAIRRVLNVNGAITDGRSDGPLRGPVGQWADELIELAVGYGFDTFLLWAEGDDRSSGSPRRSSPRPVNRWPPRPADRPGTSGRSATAPAKTRF